MFQRFASLLGAVALLLSAAQPARAQHRIQVRTYPGYGYGGFYPYYGYDGFYSNGFSMYGPPVPTYGPVPGYFGGGDQRLNNYYYPEPVRPSRYHQRTILVQPLPVEVERQAVDLPTEQSEPQKIDADRGSGGPGDERIIPEDFVMLYGKDSTADPDPSHNPKRRLLGSQPLW